MCSDKDKIQYRDETLNKDELIKLLEDTIIPASCTDMTPYLQPIADALMGVMPVPLYRFRTINEYSLSAFDKDLIFFSRAKDFNDPYDSLLTSPSFEDIMRCPAESIACFMNAFRDQLLKGMEIPQNIKDLFPPSLLDQMLGFMKMQLEAEEGGEMTEPNWHEIQAKLKDMVANFANDLRDSESYACFSESITSSTMWAHYADYHKGFALSYDMKSLILSKPNGIMILPVIYSDVRYDATNLLGWATAKMLGLPMNRIDQLDKIKSALYKSSEWAYEKEWRLINSADQAHTHPSLKYAPTGIYYGSRISEINKKILHNMAIEKGLKEYEMYLDRSSSDYQMRIQPLSIE